jgi:hypothetical protein
MIALVTGLKKVLLLPDVFPDFLSSYPIRRTSVVKSAHANVDLAEPNALLNFSSVLIH